MNTPLKKMFVGAFLSCLFLNVNFESNAQWVTTGTAGTTQQYTGGPVGIGITTSANMTSALNGNLYFGGITNNSQTGMRLNTDLAGNGNSFLDVRTPSTSNSVGLYFRVDATNGGTTRMFIGANGNTGIGTTSPAYKLDINGTTAMTGFKLGSSTTSGYVLTADASGNGTWQASTGGAWSISGTNQSNTNTGAVSLGTTTIPTAGPSGGYKFVVAGNSNINGSVVIGDPSSITPTSPGVAFNTPYKLFVTGGIITEKIKVSVKTTSSWADFVFDKTYKLMSLAQVEKFIEKNKHLPDVPSAEEVVKNGLDIATMDAKLLQKIEELTLYMIEMKKENEKLKERVNTLENK